MKILYIKSTQITLPSMQLALEKLGHEILEFEWGAEEIAANPEYEKEFGEFLEKNDADLALCYVFAPAVARQTHKYGLKYGVYSVDSPMYLTYLQGEPRYEDCYIFYLDRREYEMTRRKGFTNTYYLPLAADIIWTENLVIKDEEIEKYKSDISFVGSMYTENRYDECLDILTDEFKVRFSEIVEKCAFIWDGKDRLSELITPEFVKELKRLHHAEAEETPYDGMSDEYYVKTIFFGRKMANIERTLLLSLLAEKYDLSLYTRKGDVVPEGVKRYPPVDWDSEAFKVFYSSKINLNITMRSIEGGIPLRIFDIMSVGGFVLSNYQQEMTELFEEDKEIVLFRTPEEMLDKIDYYLAHEKERIRIGINGYKKVKECYNYERRMEEMISVMTNDRCDNENKVQG